jgi:hypothetical protein
MAKAAVLNIDIVATAEKALETFDKVKEKSGASFSALKVGAVAAAGAVIAGLGEATKAASEHEQVVAKMATAYKNAGLPAEEMKKALEENDAAARRTGQSAEDLDTAYTQLVTATHSSATAHKELATAQDLAAYKGISVADAATLITQASVGNTRAVKELGIATKDASGHQLSAAAIMDKLTLAVHGQANAMGDTAAGKMARYKESLDQTKVAIGESLMPALQGLLNILQPIFNWLSQNTAVIRVLAPIIGILAGVVIAVSAATRVWAAVQAVLNVVMSANPIGIVILAVAGLVAGVIVAIKYWHDISAAINVAWGWMQSLGAWIMGHWRIIVDVLLGPMGLIITNFQTIIRVVDDVIVALEKVGHAVSSALGWLGKLPSGAGSILSKLNPFSLPGGSGPAPTPVLIQVNATPGSDLPEVVYQALRDYQRRHVRPELRAAFG